MKKTLFESLILLSSFCAGLVFAQETNNDDMLELFEFLADWEEQEGEWIDPLSMEQEDTNSNCESDSKSNTTQDNEVNCDEN